MIRHSRSSADASLSSRSASMRTVPRTAERGRHEVVTQVEIEEQSLPLPFFRHQRDARRGRLSRGMPAQLASVEQQARRRSPGAGRTPSPPVPSAPTPRVRRARRSRRAHAHRGCLVGREGGSDHGRGVSMDSNLPPPGTTRRWPSPRTRPPSRCRGVSRSTWRSCRSRSSRSSSSRSSSPPGHSSPRTPIARPMRRSAIAALPLMLAACALGGRVEVLLSSPGRRSCWRSRMAPTVTLRSATSSSRRARGRARRLPRRAAARRAAARRFRFPSVVGTYRVTVDGKTVWEDAVPLHARTREAPW